MNIMCYVSVNEPNMPCRGRPIPPHEHTSMLEDPYNKKV